MFVYIKKASYVRPEVKAFAEYMIANQETIATEALFVPLTAPQVKTAKAALAAS